MENEIYFEGIKFIPAAEAASFVGLTRDHISRLCKSGKITGKFIGKHWYVSEKSLHEFAILYHYQKALRKDALARERKEGYKSAASVREPVLGHTPMDVTDRLLHALSAPAGVSDAMIATAHLPAYSLGPTFEVAHRLLAVALAIVLVFSTFTLAAPQLSRALVFGMKKGMNDQSRMVSDLGVSALHFDATKSLNGTSGEFAAVNAIPRGVGMILESIQNLISN